MKVSAPTAARRPDTSPERTFVRAFQSLVGEVFRLNGELLAAADQLSRDLVVGPAGWQTIAVIRNQPMTVSQIARRLGLRRQSVQRNVNVLKKQGLVELRANPAHKRAHLVKLTRRGRRMMDTLRERQAELAMKFMRGLSWSADDVTELADTLRRLRENAGKSG